MKKLLRSALVAVLVVFVLSAGCVFAHATGHSAHPACGKYCSHTEKHSTMSNLRSWTGGTFYYNGDYYLNYDITVSKRITINKNVRLCLNGHTVTFADGYGFTVESGGSLTICDCKGTGGMVRGPLQSSGDSSIGVNYGSLTIYGGEYCPDGTGVSIVNYGTMEIYDGSFGIGINNYAYGNTYGALTIHKAEFYISDYDCFYNDAKCTMVINGGSFGAWDGVLTNYGTATINGGSFYATREEWLGASIIGSDCIDNKGTLTVNGGEISSVRGYGIDNQYYSSYETNYKGVRASLTVNGGSVISGVGKAALYNTGNAYIYGGSFSGYIGIENDSNIVGSTETGGSCKIYGGSMSGEKCGILNSGSTYTSYVNGVGKEMYSKAALEIRNSPTVSKLILEYPDALTFSFYNGKIIDLELDMDYIALEDRITGSCNNLWKLNLLNEGYVLQKGSSADTVLATNHCGKNGDNLRWKLNADGVLTIYGTGEMKNYSYSAQLPWDKSKTMIDVTAVVIENGVTSIGSSAFAYAAISEITIPEGITSIGKWAFEGCANLKDMYLPLSLKKIDKNIFAGLGSLPENIYYAGCSHLWQQIELASQTREFIPICAENANTDDGDCTTALICSVCGGADVEAREAHSGGTATCTELASCEVCGSAYGDYGHIFDRMECADEYLKEAGSCTEAAVYYYSCACGAKGSESFTGPDAPGHIYDFERAEEQYLLYEASCTEGGYYFKSCVCGLASDSDVFQGAPLGHSFTSYTADSSITESALCDRADCGETHTRYRLLTEIFPDSNFLACVLSDVLGCGGEENDGRLTDEGLGAIKNCTELDLRDKNISSPEGLELFSGLKVLRCGGNPISELPLESLGALESLDCADMLLTELDLSKSAALKELDCSGNAIEKLDLGACTLLEKLNCSHNRLSLLDLADNTAIRELNCAGQTVEKTGIEVADTGRGWTLDMAAFLGEGAELERLSMRDGGVLDGDGIVSYSTKPAVVEYSYDTGCVIDGEAVLMDAVWTAVHGPAHVHVFDREETGDEHLKAPASCTDAAEYYLSCACGENGGETFSYGETTDHSFDCQVSEEEYLESAASCTEKARYYYSCVCGEKGSDSYEYGEVLPHSYDCQNTDEKYLKTPASCTKAAFYYKSCVCGEMGTGIFVSGKSLGHDYGYRWEEDGCEKTCVYGCSRCDSGKKSFVTLSFDAESMRLAVSGSIPEGVSVYAAAYSASGRFAGLRSVQSGAEISFPGAESIGLYVLGENYAPLTDKFEIR